MSANRTLHGCLPHTETPVYSIGVASGLIGVHPRTLRLYEAEGLIQPKYSGARRLYSRNDIQWITCLRSLIHDEGISIPGLKKLLNLLPCWEIAECPPEIHETCDAKVDFRMSFLDNCPRSYNCHAQKESNASQESCVKKLGQFESGINNGFIMPCYSSFTGAVATT